MGVQITTAFVEQYKANVAMLAQQKGSRLRKAVTEEPVTGESAFFEQIGLTQMTEETSRDTDTPLISVPHLRRRVSMRTFSWAALVNSSDKVRMLIDPTSTYVEAAVEASNRQIDDLIIEAATGTAYTDKTGSTATPFDTNMVVGVQTRDVGVTAADYGLNVAKIIAANGLFMANEVDPDEQKFLIYNSRQMTSLLNSTRATSADYQTVHNLAKGIVSDFGGFTFIQSERIGTDANSDDKVLVFAKSGIKFGIGKDLDAFIDMRPDKNRATQVFTEITMGVTRMEETKVGYIACDIAAGPGA